MTARSSLVHPPELADRPPTAWGAVGSAVAVLAVLLTVTSGAYGYHRDELYFRMLPPAWGYLDQPPLTPLLVHGISALTDEVWAVRVPATVAALVAVVLVALVARELGGGRFAQGLAAWGYGFGSFPLVFGHTMLTAGPDLVAWLAASLFVLRAVIRRQGHWWLWAGLVVGLATYNKLLVALLVLSLAAGLAAVGPRPLPWRQVATGALVAAVLSVPAIAYQQLHGWPQLSMGRALTARNGAANRALMVPMLLVLIGPLLVPVWVAGLVALWRRPAVRFVAVAFGVLFVLSFVSAGQVYYPLGLLAVGYAAGCVPVARWVSGSTGRRRLVVGAVAVDAVVASVISLPVLPVSVVGRTPVPTINQAARDTVGWPAYVQQVASVYSSLSPAERAGAAVVTTNYGEAGAVARYGPALGLPAPLSGHNQLWFEGRPPTTAAVLVVVGKGAAAVAARNSTCVVLARLDDGVGVANEEQGQPVSVCRDARQPWSTVWGSFQHED